MKNFLSFLFIAALFSNATAQNLPGVQQLSVKAPASLKIDGHTDEWAPFKADNNDIASLYTIANDDINLYLAIKMNSLRILEKILTVGITFTVNKDRVKDYKAVGNKAITFPLLDVTKRYFILRAAGAGTLSIPVNIAGPIIISPIKPADSANLLANKLLKEGATTIKVDGFTGLPDTISIRNAHNITAGLNLDKNGFYTYELQVPLKLLGLDNTGPKPFSYSIKLRSILELRKGNEGKVYHYRMEGNRNPNFDLNGTADFWGEYILAK